ncbi:Carboxypeptidase regulatory-like domain-containing protein [Hymenobacter actinosclerus]|uniref:Carboxypeptidase regulatory-like domain-containing protein n=2 Tax=Hymenobacter actinosclerus TaxID=82805 RepID=A0A1H9YQR1_9BACT|nr:Carboxypeptidase regulatory-like domain-containing protein [Hymenobacter actinosclerus]
MLTNMLPASLLLGGLLLYGAGAAAQQPTAPLPATVPAYEPPPGKPYFTQPAEAGAAAVTAGLVVDNETGQPLAGVTCWIRGTRLAVFTDCNGRYRLPVPARYLSRRGQVKITLSSIGFMGQALRLDARLTEQPVVRLLPDTRPLY